MRQLAHCSAAPFGRSGDCTVSSCSQSETLKSILNLEGRLKFWRETDERAPRDLAALGIDSPYLRWRQVTRYIAHERQQALAGIRAAVREILFYERVNRNWHQRGSPDGGPRRDDVADAVGWFQDTFCIFGEEAV